jgi:rhodanese-related sulfurtransferase
MRKRFLLLLSLLVLTGMVLAACGGADAPTAEPVVEEPAVEEPVVEEPTEEPVVEEPVEEPAEVAPPDLDAAFSGLLANMEAYNTVKADTLLAEMVEDAPPFLLDVRTTGEVEENGHIEGAINVPLNELAQHLDVLPDFETPIVAYCGSGWRATIAMAALDALGWNDVSALKTTFADWKDAGNPVVDGPAADPIVLDVAAPDPGMVEAVDAMLAIYGVKPFGVITADDLNVALVDNPDLQVIDVRRVEEVDEKGTIDAANFVHIPLEQFVADMSQWSVKDSSIVIYCGSGHRSTMALAIMGTYGYGDVKSLKGGFGGWKDAGFPTVGGVPAAPAVETGFQTMLETMVGYNTVRADDLMTELTEDQPPFLLDVRTTGELEEKGHITGATHIQLEELTQKTNLLPSFDTPIVAYCGSGWRATIAMTMLHGMGYTDVRALKTTFEDWVEAGNPVYAGVPEELVLDAASVDSAILSVVDQALSVYGVKPYGGISADDFNVALADNPDLVVIDVRRQEELDSKGYIDAPNFIHIPMEQFVANKEMWPAADDSVVIYCGSGHRSTMATAILGAYGYKDVLSLKSGFGGWVDAGYPIVSAAPAFQTNFVNMLTGMEGYNTIKADGLMAELIEDQPPFLLDVRTTPELEEKGHIEGATHIPLNELAQHIDLLPGFDTPIVAYCGSGWRATIAMTTLYGMGYQDVRALKTTFADWVEAGNPVAAGVPDLMVLNAVEIDEALLSEFDAMLQGIGNKPYGVITADDLNLALTENPGMFVIDVRRLEELTEKGVIDTGDVSFTHIALEEFIAQMGMWPMDKDAKIVVYCGSGHRSTMAATILTAYGYSDVTSLMGGFGGWVESAFPVLEFAAP